MKPGEITYDFSKIEKSEACQKLLKWSLKNKMAEINVDECKEAMREFSGRFIRKSK